MKLFRIASDVSRINLFLCLGWLLSFIGSFWFELGRSQQHWLLALLFLSTVHITILEWRIARLTRLLDKSVANTTRALIRATRFQP